ncbi:hypothetical protein [Paeniglutamicibacter terrestris]|uniref:Uncharacterized protein n=1 Tax=Paeniglutamicibacter terrestris TaxID=2723403 RepID=A0ABX1G837_9MICC|nr:hypothetical protein [Paeniglutamicibacter terrestris]NKG22394.1 hypothetical protein [Paeniglutamicibacter terrestris]
MISSNSQIVADELGEADKYSLASAFICLSPTLNPESAFSLNRDVRGDAQPGSTNGDNNV